MLSKANNKADRKLKADGTILLKLPDGSRQLMSIHRTPLNHGSIRALEQERQHLPKAGIASSAFAVDSIAINESLLMPRFRVRAWHDEPLRNDHVARVRYGRLPVNDR